MAIFHLRSIPSRSSNVVGTIVPTVRQNTSNSTNLFSVVGPSNTSASPTHGKSSFIDASQLFDDPDMPELEDITYSNDENDVATQTRSMTRVVKDQGGLSQMFNDDFHTYMFSCFLSQEEPKRPEFEVNVSPSSSAQSRKQDDKTKKEAKGKSPVESFTRYRDLSAEFEDCSNNSSNEVNVADVLHQAVLDSVAIKQVNDVTRLQALVDKKKVVVTEAAIREDIKEEGDADEHVKEVTAGDDAHGEVPTVA
nr:hypothetical protein [Tanacetum cinerariifolium]